MKKIPNEIDEIREELVTPPPADPALIKEALAQGCAFDTLN
jgi:hypothetical protein